MNLARHAFPAPAPLPVRRAAGFTLVELLIVMSIIAILAAIAIPSYDQFVRRGARSAAQTEMLSIANRQEQYLLSNRTYATKDVLVANGYAVDAGVARKYNYTVTVGAGTVPSYMITFTPISPGPQASDPVLTLDNSGNKTPADKW